MDYVVAGNIIGIIGIPSAFSGETLCDPACPIHPFEAIRHIFEPVVTKAIEARQTKDLPKVIEFLRKVSREDPTIMVKIDQETGQHLVSGLGELHLDAKVERVLREKGIEIKTSEPIVVYRETISGSGGPVEGKSPNKHNLFYLRVKPLPKGVWEAMVSGEIRDQEVKKKDPGLTKKLQELGLDREAARGVREIYNRCIFSDVTRGIQYLHEAMELVKQGVRSVIDSGPLTQEPCSGILIELVDAELHEDAIHRGPAQVIPAVRFSIRNSMLRAGSTLLEPKQTIRIDCPEEELGAAMREVQNRRGVILETTREAGAVVLKAKLPVADMFGFEGALKSATGGKGFYSLIDVEFEPLPRELLERVVKDIRQRKGLPAEIPKPEA
jgi:elongation factor 2